MNANHPFLSSATLPSARRPVSPSPQATVVRSPVPTESPSFLLRSVPQLRPTPRVATLQDMSYTFVLPFVVISIESPLFLLHLSPNSVQYLGLSPSSSICVALCSHLLMLCYMKMPSIDPKHTKAPAKPSFRMQEYNHFDLTSTFRLKNKHISNA